MFHVEQFRLAETELQSKMFHVEHGETRHSMVRNEVPNRAPYRTRDPIRITRCSVAGMPSGGSHSMVGLAKLPSSVES